MADFSVSALLEAEVDPQSLRAAKAEVEDELGDVTVTPTVGGGAGGPSPASPDGGMLGGNDMGTLVKLVEEQRDIQDDILDELEAGFGGGPGNNILNFGGNGPGFFGGLGLGLGSKTLGRLAGAATGLASVSAGVAGLTALATLGPTAAAIAANPEAENVGGQRGITGSQEALQQAAQSTGFSPSDGGKSGGGFIGDFFTGLSNINTDELDLEVPRPPWLDDLKIGTPVAQTDEFIEDEGSVTRTRSGDPTGPVAQTDEFIQNFGSVTRGRDGSPSGSRGEGGGDTNVNVEANAEVTQEGLSEREIDRKIDEATEEAKKQAKEEVRRELVGGRTGI